MSRPAQTIEPIPEEDLNAVADEFLACALKAVEGQVPSQRKLAVLLG